MRRLCSAALFFLILISVSVSTRGQQNPLLVSKLALVTDLEVPAGSIDLRLQRKHITNRSLRGPLGTRWRHNWECRLSRVGGKVQIEDWEGVASFTRIGK